MAGFARPDRRLLFWLVKYYCSPFSILRFAASIILPDKGKPNRDLCKA